MSKLVSSFGSLSGSRDSEPKPLTFPSNWGVGPIFSWYNSLPDRRAKSIKILQIWKNITGPVPHRFVVLRMCDDRAHRFDRRPALGPESSTRMRDLLFNHAVTSQDTYMLDIPPINIEQGSLCEIELFVDGRVDLLAVISACYAISNDNYTREYTFLRHNCFFFSWAILMVVTRHYLPYEVPQFDSIARRSQLQLERLTSFIVDETIALFLDLVMDAIMVFREKADMSLRKGMNMIEGIMWTLPIGVLRFSYRQFFTVQLHLGLRSQLTKRVRTQLLKKGDMVFKAMLSKHMTRDLLDAHLWIEETKKPVRHSLKAEITKIFWDALLEAISLGLVNVNPEQFVNTNLNFSLCDVWSAALHGGLLAAKKAAQGFGNISHGEAFDRAWFAARDAALAAEKDAVFRDTSIKNKPQREAMWNSVWAIWEECWVETHKVTRPRAVQVIEKIVEELITTGTGIIMQDMKESKNRTIQVRMAEQGLGKRMSSHHESITNARLQEYMRNIIKNGTVNAEALGAVNRSMARIWGEARQHLAIPVGALDAITEND